MGNSNQDLIHAATYLGTLKLGMFMELKSNSDYLLMERNYFPFNKKPSSLTFRKSSAYEARIACWLPKKNRNEYFVHFVQQMAPYLMPFAFAN